MITRRPIASVIARERRATPAGVAASPSSTSTLRGVALLLGERAQARAALGDRAVVVAVDQVGGLQLGHRAECMGWCDALAHDEVHELARHHDLLDDLLAVEVRLHVRRRQAQLLQLLRARVRSRPARGRAACR